MKFAKLLLHSLPGGALLALLVALLLFYLNPQRILDGPGLWRAWLPLMASYGLVAAVVWPLGVLAIRFFAHRGMKLSWVSFALLHRFYLVNSTLAAAVWWGNFSATPALLSPPDRRLLLAGCGLLTLGCALGGVLSLQRLIFGKAARRWVQGAQAVVALALFAALIALRAGGVGSGGPPAPRQGPELERPETGRRAVLVAVDGMSLDLILPLAADGKASTFRYLMRQGAWGRVESFVPTTPPVVWTTVATGAMPYQHGVLDFSRYQTLGGDLSMALAPRYVFFRRLESLGLLSTRPVASGDRQLPAFWNILAWFGMDVKVLDWWATFPAELPDGAVVPQPPGGWPVPKRGTPALLSSAPELVREVEERLGRMADWAGSPDPGAEFLEATVRQALALDLLAIAEARRIEADDPPTLLAFYLPGLDLVQHRFLGYALEASHSEGAERAGALYGEVVPRYYRFLDEVLGSFLNPAGEDSRLLLLVSGFGVERVPPWSLRRILSGAPSGEGYHDRAPAGTYFALGGGVAAGGQERGATVPADVLPTLLYYLGLPVGRDMHGRPRVDWFDDAFARSQPLVTVSSYRSVRAVPAAVTPPPPPGP